MENKKFILKNCTAIAFILIGIICILLVMLLETPASSGGVKITLNIIDHIGIGCFILGILSILIETNHWTKYFKDRLSEIVIEKEYLEKYSQDQLVSLQTDVLKMYFRDSSIDEKDGFLTYYQNHIQEMIGKPFRTDISGYLVINYCDDSKDQLEINDTISWICKSNRGVIQDFIEWLPEEDEFDKLEIKSIQFEYNGLCKKIEYNEFLDNWKLEDGGAKIPVPEEYKKDGLKVTVTSIYSIKTTKFIAWRMAYISRGISVMVTYPNDLKLYRELYLMINKCEEKNDPGFYNWQSKEWILPNEGIVFQLIPR